MGENRIKLVAADMDGTLLNRERKITKYTQNVIKKAMAQGAVSYTHLRAHETRGNLVCRLLLEKKK